METSPEDRIFKMKLVPYLGAGRKNTGEKMIMKICFKFVNYACKGNAHRYCSTAN